MSVPDVVERVSPKDLIMLPYREVECDDTLREFKQVLRFDFISGNPLRSQLLLDRRHKQNKALSKPVAYFRMTSPDQLIKLGNTALAVATVLAFAEQDHLAPSVDEIKSAVRSLAHQFTEPDVCSAVGVMLRDVYLREMAKQKTEATASV